MLCSQTTAQTRRDRTDCRSEGFSTVCELNDRERLLDDSHWPESVMISEWYFLPPDRERRPTTSTSSASADVGHSAVAARSTTVTAATVTVVSSGPVVSVLPTASTSVTPTATDAMDVSVSAAPVDNDFNDTTIAIVDGDQQ